MNQSSINKLKLKSNYEECDDETDFDDGNVNQIDKNNVLDCSETETIKNFVLCCSFEEKVLSFSCPLRPCGHMVCQICLRHRCSNCFRVYTAEDEKFR